MIYSYRCNRDKILQWGKRQKWLLLMEEHYSDTFVTPSGNIIIITYDFETSDQVIHVNEGSRE